MPCVSDTLINDSLKEHAKNLSIESPELTEEFETFVSNSFHQLFPKRIEYGDIIEKPPKSISMRACFENGVSKGGSYYQYLKDYEGVDMMDLPSRFHYVTRFPDLVGVVVNEGGRVSYQDLPYRYADDKRAISTCHWLYWYAPIDNFEHAVHDAIRLSEVRSEAVALPEPLKVRVITKSNYRANSFINIIQKILWKQLRKFKQFSLVGEEVCEDLIVNLIKDSDKMGLGPWFNSGDYSKATDTLSANVTKLLIKHLSGDPIIEKILRQSLCDNIVDYPKDSGVESIQMRVGQLMGCIYSFPILCLANFLVYAFSFYKYHPDLAHVPLANLPVLVNGDDILFRDDYTMCRLWEEDIKTVGFQKSVGKNYLSKDFMLINSHMYYKDGSNIPYCNTGLINGKKKGAKSKDLNKIKVNGEQFSNFVSAIQGCSKEWIQCGMSSLQIRRGFEWMYIMKARKIQMLNLAINILDGKVNAGMDIEKRSSPSIIKFSEEVLGRLVCSMNAGHDVFPCTRELYKAFGRLPVKISDQEAMKHKYYSHHYKQYLKDKKDGKLPDYFDHRLFESMYRSNYVEVSHHLRSISNYYFDDEDPIHASWVLNWLWGTNRPCRQGLRNGVFLREDGPVSNVSSRQPTCETNELVADTVC